MEYDLDHQHSPSFRLKLKSSICASSCFTNHSEAASSSTCSDDEPFHRPALSSRSSWIRSKAHDLPEEIRERCARVFSKIVAGGGKASRRPNNTSEFRYDPMSYALNFDDEAARIDEFPLSARFPSSPPPKSTRAEKRFPAAAVSRQIAACS